MVETQKQAGIDFVICGLEHSGTTLASDLFRQVPGCESGFECGVMLARTPRDFPTLQPFYDNIKDGWQITDIDTAKACQTDSFADFYHRLFEVSGIFKTRKPTIRFDKTPRYIISLPVIAEITGKPIIAMIKDPRALVLSDFRRSKRSAEDIEAWYQEWMPSKRRYMEQAYQGYLYAWRSKQCLVVRLEDICLNTRITLETMFSHVGLELSLNYLNIKDSRYAHTRGKSINTSMAVEHLARLPDGIQQRVLDDFGHLQRWFYAF